MMAVGAVKPRVIIHLAGIVGAPCEADPELAEKVNVGGTANLAAAASEHGVERIVFVSTAGVYGDSRRRPVSEADAPQPTGVYSTTKLLAEAALADIFPSVGVDILRVFNIYGEGMHDSLVSRLQNASAANPVRLTGLDEFVRDYVHVDDVARALLASAVSRSREFRILNVGSGVARSNRDLLAAIPVADPAAVVVSSAVESYSCADISAIHKELSWRPSMPWPPTSPGGV